MDLAIQIISDDKTTGNDTMVDLKEFNKLSSATEAEKGERIVSLMPVI